MNNDFVKTLNVSSNILGIINKVSSFKRVLNKYYPIIINHLDKFELEPKIDKYIQPEHPLFIQTLKEMGYHKEDIESILVDYYSGHESLQHILKNSSFVVVSGVLTFLVVYGTYYLSPVFQTIKNEKQLFDYYNNVLQFIQIDSESDSE